MSDYSAFAGAQMLATQLSIDRFMDSLERNRDVGALAHNDAAWRSQYNDLVNRYNALIAATNRLCRSHDAQIEAMDGSLDALRGSVSILEASQAQLTSELAREKERYASLLLIHKDWDPNYEPYED